MQSVEFLQIDEAEAIGNMETSFESVINSYYSLKDLSEKECKKFDWYNKPGNLILLLIRNVRHHNLAKNIRSIYCQENRKNKEKKIFVDFEGIEKGSYTFDYYLSWSDTNELLNLDSNQSRIKSPKKAKELLYEYFNGDKLNSYSKEYGVNPDKTYINIVQIIVDAMKELFPDFENDVNPELSGESDIFKYNFSSVKGFDCKKHKIQILNG